MYTCYECFDHRSTKIRLLGALGNAADTSGEWIQFIRFYLSKLQQVSFDTVIMEHEKWKLHVLNEFLIVITLDYSANCKAVGARKNAQIYLAICYHKKGSINKPLHSFEGDLYEFESADGKNRYLFEQLPQISYLKYRPMKQNNTR